MRKRSQFFNCQLIFLLLQTENVEEIALKISEWPLAQGKQKRIVVITQGADPVVIAEDGKITTYSVIPLPKEKLVDTNGAGTFMLLVLIILYYYFFFLMYTVLCFP